MHSNKSLFQPVEVKPDNSPLTVSFADEKLIFTGSFDRLNNFLLVLTGKCFLTFNGVANPPTVTVFGYVNAPRDIAKMTPELAVRVFQLLHERNHITETEKTNLTAAVMPQPRLNI